MIDESAHDDNTHNTDQGHTQAADQTIKSNDLSTRI
jgi:hypothetical protein